MAEELMVKVDNVHKKYRLGLIGGGTLTGDLQSWWAKVRHKEDPNSKIGEKAYGKNEVFYALNGISFEVRKGEALGIIGGNGAGKSTTLKLLSQVTAPTTVHTTTQYVMPYDVITVAATVRSLPEWRPVSTSRQESAWSLSKRNCPNCGCTA